MKNNPTVPERNKGFPTRSSPKSTGFLQTQLSSLVFDEITLPEDKEG